MRAAMIIVLGAAALAGCKSTPQSGSWASRGWNALEQDVETATETLTKEGLRHYAAAAILLVLVAGCWSRVRAVSHRHAETLAEEGDGEQHI